MESLRFIEMLKLWVAFCCSFCLMNSFTAFANVALIGNNFTLTFPDTEANFAPSVKTSGICGSLYVAEPLDACSTLTNRVVPLKNNTFALIARGGCSFDEKVRKAQAAGFKAAIVYDNENGDLIAMAGISTGIKIFAVFVSKGCAETLTKHAGDADMQVCISPSYEGSAWSIMAISFISLLAMSTALATCFFVRRHCFRWEHPRVPQVRDFHGMSSRLVKAMPTLVFTAVLEDNCTSATCAICLDDYITGEKLRILPCRHKFHAICVDAWLTSWRTFCPVCKRDARTISGEPHASESTPLLSSTLGSFPPSSALSSFQSSLASTSPIQIHNPSSVSQPHSVSSSPYTRQSPHLNASQSSVNLRNISSQISRGPYLVSPHSLGYPSLSSLNSRYLSPYIPSPANASSSRLGNPLHCSESATSFSPFASAQSLPDC